MSGRTFGRFEVRGELGRGTYGVVLDAYDPATDRSVALKLLREGERAQFENIERLRREAEALARLRHPNVVTVHEAGARDGFHYVVLEQVTGRSFDEVMRTVPLAQRLQVIEQAARGLHAAHEVGVVHRDVKPANILVDDEGRARVIDFGLAALAGASVALSDPGTFVGTPAYASPEQTRLDRAAIGAASDIYSLGAILFEALTGELVYPSARSVGSFIEKVTSPAPSPRPRERVKGIPPALDAICSRALEKEPGRRFATAHELAEALRGARLALEAPAPREQLILRVLLAVALLLAVAVVVVALRLVSSATATPAPATPAPPPPPPPVPPVRPRPPSVPLAAPRWFTLLREAERPALPLPRGVSFGERPGEYVNERDRSVLVYVPAGDFLMGSEEGDDRERPPHPVLLSGYFVGKLEVTIEQFAAFVASASYVTTAEKKGSSIFLTDQGEREAACHAAWSDPDGTHTRPRGDCPVAHVSWFDATAYSVWAGLALPTEAQWEKAAAWDPVAKRSRRYAWGDVAANAASPKVANVLDETFKRQFPNVSCFDGYEDGYVRAAPVGSFPDGASCYGALDMTGNVAEWCADLYDEGFYARSPRNDPVGTQGSQMVIRGGSFTYGPKSCRAARRGAADPERTGANLGFRIALPAR